MARAPSPAPDLAPAYRVSVTRADNGAANAGWLAEVEGLPECSARGETPEEAVARSMSTLAGRSSDGSGGGEAKSEAMSRRSGKILVRMPVTLHDELAKAAGAEGVSLNQLITGFLAGAVAWRGDGVGENSVGGKSTSAASSASARRGPESERLMRIALAVNLGAVVVAAIAAVVLIVLAWQHGW